jgi:SAM-dependent methyltransferase
MATNWTGAAAAYDASFAPMCGGAIPSLIGCLPSADAAPRVLDAGTGTGRVAAALAAAGHDVTAVDAAQDMLDFAASQPGRDGIRFERADLMTLPFADGSFDASVANFVVNHVRVPRTGVRELARVTRPDGVVAVTIWPSEPVTAFNALWNEVIERSGAVRPAGLRLPAEDDFERSVDGLAGVLSGAGLADVEATEVSWVFRATPESLWAGAEAGIATIGTTYLAQDEQTRSRMRAAFEALTGAAELELPSTAVIASGRR